MFGRRQSIVARFDGERANVRIDSGRPLGYLDLNRRADLLCDRSVFVVSGLFTDRFCMYAYAHTASRWFTDSQLVHFHWRRVGVFLWFDFVWQYQQVRYALRRSGGMVYVSKY